MEFFTGALEKYTVALLTKISEDYSLPLEDLVAKYQSVPLKKKRAPKKPKDPNEPEVPKVPCVGLTGKGTPCKNKCQPGSDKCHLHGVDLPGAVPKVPKTPKEPKVPKVPKKVKKIQPEHNHPPGSQSDECQLCETHGNVVIPKLPQFESKSLQDRLAEILKSETQETEEAEEPTPVSPEKPKKAAAKKKAEPVQTQTEAKAKPKKAKKAKSPEPAPPPPPPPPEPVKVPKGASIEERMALILSEEDEEEEEPESPGAVRHRLIMAEKGLPVEYDEDEDEEELNEDEIDNGFLTEEEFDEE